MSLSLALVVAGAALALAADQPEPLCPLDASGDQCKNSQSRFSMEGVSRAARAVPLDLGMDIDYDLDLLRTKCDLVPALELPELRCWFDATEDKCLQYSSTRFSVTGRDIRFPYEGDMLLTLQCDDSLWLDYVLEHLPKFKPALRVSNVTVVNCPPAHYSTVLRALNVTMTWSFHLELLGTRDQSLAAHHLAYLPPLRHLTIRDARVLHSLPISLEGLTVKRTSLSDNLLEALPRTLTELWLDEVNNTRVPAALLELPELHSLHFVVDDIETGVTVERSNTSKLRQLYVVAADAALLSEWAPPALEEVTLKYWQAYRPNPLPSCDYLVKLTLYYPQVRSLPAGWVARCPRLEVLHITGMHDVLELPAELLENATQLISLKIDSTYLSSLPAQLFADTFHLTHLDLSLNQLKELPSSMLTLPLLSLNLRSNLFNESVAAELATLTEVRNLSLSWNKRLGDLCAINDSNLTGKSPLASLSKLQRLELQDTKVSVICSDWREDMVNLKYLDLSYTNIQNLTYEDLQYKRNVLAVVKLAGSMHFTADDYDRAAAAATAAPPSRHVTLKLFRDTLYECKFYWITKALNGSLLPLYDVHLYYETSLRSVRAEVLCPNRETCATVPAGCDCGMAGGGLLRVVCVGVQLDRVPQLLTLDNDTDVQAVDLVLSNNTITELGVDDLPSHLRVLDLRNNSISYMTEATARALVSGTKRRVLLAGNRLDCSCRATPALRVLRDHAAVLVGYAALRCEDGGTLQDAVDACSIQVISASPRTTRS